MRLAVLAAATMAVACSTGGGSDPGDAGFSLSGAQATAVATVISFVTAYNAEDVARALSLLTDDVTVSDCDYRSRSVSEFVGKDQVTAWLRQRLADHDRLVVRAIWNHNPQGATPVVGVSWERRTADSLRALGFPDGVKPQIDAKVIFRQSSISRLAMGPEGGSSQGCRLVPVSL